MEREHVVQAWKQWMEACCLLLSITVPIEIGFTYFYSSATVISVLDSSQIRFLEIHNETNLPDYSQSGVLVVGDVMLDRYWYGPTGRISPEAPYPL